MYSKVATSSSATFSTSSSQTTPLPVGGCGEATCSRLWQVGFVDIFNVSALKCDLTYECTVLTIQSSAVYTVHTIQSSAGYTVHTM